MADQMDLDELQDLKKFITDAIGRADPTLDTSSGSPIDIYLITPLISRLSPDSFSTPLVDLLRARVASEFPDVIAQEGEPIDDLVIKPMQVLISPFRKSINQVKINQSFQDPKQLSDEDADALGANFFAPRKEGKYSTGVARLYYSAPQSDTITPSNPVYTSDGLRFLPIDNQSIRADSMIFNTEGTLYYFDIVVRAEAQGSEYNISAGSLNSIEGKNKVVRVTNKAKFEWGEAREDTETYVERIKQSLTEKSLVTARGILARLFEVFPSLRTLQVIGYGDPEMNRDILTGSDAPHTYAQLKGAVITGQQDRIAVSEVNDGTATHTNLYDLGIQTLDTVQFYESTTHTVHTSYVVEIVSSMVLKVAPNLPIASLNYQYSLARTNGTLTLSGMPAGVVDVGTPAGDVEVNDGEIHIGGQTDIYCRGGDPQNQSITISSVRDEQPLRFGLDLESFGEDDDVFIQLTPPISSAMKVPTDGDELLVKILSGGKVPWEPTDQDIDRYVQILSGTDTGTFKITEIMGKELDGSDVVVRVKVDLYDEDSGATLTDISLTAGYTVGFRLRGKISVKRLVRDRDGSRPTYGAGVDFVALGAEIGDSLVIESGDDAGVYSIRRMLDSLDTNDTLKLDRDLTKNVTPTGTGDYSGLRYRVNNELELDLVSPKTPKIPIGNIFAGDDLNSIAGSTSVSFSGTTNLLLAGVAVNDILEVPEGDNKGKYSIKSFAGTTAVLATAMKSTLNAQDFYIYTQFTGIMRPMVRVKDVELLDSSNQPTGVKAPYGKPVDIRVHSDLSNRAEGDAAESYVGYVTDYTTNRVYDADINFEAKGVQPNYRMSIKSTSNAGDYIVKAVAPSTDPTPWWVDLYTATEGGRDLRVNVASMHYQVGEPSTGVARLFFVEPTSVEVYTGMLGGRLQYSPSGTPATDMQLLTEDPTLKMFMFSEVEGKLVLPEGGSGDANPRGIRVVRSFTDGGDDFTILELPDDVTDVWGLELQVGDLVEVYEQIPMRDSGGNEIIPQGFFGNLAGLMTLTGSNRVSIPANSNIDFTEVDAVDPLVGQLLYIESGPDTGTYEIEEVVDAKTLRINTVMVSTTSAILGRDTDRVCELKAGSGPTNCRLKDSTDSGALGTQVGGFVTIFESTVDGIEGSHEILAAAVIGADAPYLEIDLTLASPTSNTFTWIRTSSDENVMQSFRIYNTVPLQVVVTEVGTKEPDILPGVRDGDIISTTELQDISGVVGISPGDLLEILAGDAAGTYPIESVVTNKITVYAAHSFPVIEPGVKYRIRGGIHGADRMVTVGSWEGGRSLIVPGELLPFRIRRTGTFRLSSTEMKGQFDGSLYYAEIQIESLGCGDDLNLASDTKMWPISGISADGYTYDVANSSFTFSPYEEVLLRFTRRFLPVGNSDAPENMMEITGRNLKINYQNSTLVGLINDYVRSENERANNASTIARHLLPSYILMTIRYSGGKSQADVSKAVEDYINQQRTTGSLEISDIEAIVTRMGASYVQHPLLLVAVVHDVDRNLIVDRSDDKIGGTIVYYNGSARTTCYFAISGEGLNVEKLS